VADDEISGTDQKAQITQAVAKPGEAAREAVHSRSDAFGRSGGFAALREWMPSAKLAPTFWSPPVPTFRTSRIAVQAVDENVPSRG